MSRPPARLEVVLAPGRGKEHSPFILTKRIVIMKWDDNRNLSRVVRTRVTTISIARSSTRIVSPMMYRNSSTFLHPFARSALPDFIAHMGALTPAGRVLRLGEHERPTTSQQASLLISFDLPTIPSSTTLLPFPSGHFVTLHQCQRLPRLSPGLTVGQRECRRAVWGSPVTSRLPDRLGRNRFALLRTGRSPQLLPTPPHGDAVTFSYGFVT